MNSEKYCLDKFKLKINTHLYKNGFVFLIKTNDSLFDKYLLDKISINKDYFKRSDDFIEIYNTNSKEIEEIQYEFINIQTVNKELLITLANLNENKKGGELLKTIYFLPKYIIYKFFEHKSVDDLLSSCIFLSEELQDLGQVVVDNSLKIVFGENVPLPINEYISGILQNNNTSLSKIIFFASSFKSALLEYSEASKNMRLNSLPMETFLDDKGSEFLAALSISVPLESIETVFRVFILIEKDNIIPLELKFEEISSFSQVPVDQLNNILELSLSSQFQILTKKEDLYSFKMVDYLSDWKALSRWIKNEESAIKQYKQLEALAHDYFKSSGTLLSKEQIEQTLSWKADTLTHYNSWKEKYILDEDLISSYLLLSKNSLEESIKKQQKKRSRLLKNSIRISIAVSIAFLLSSFTALLAYLERNSAIKQQELAIQAKEDADQARTVAEIERLEAVKARQNESSALAKAEIERLLAIDAKGQAEIQKKNALGALDMAQKSEIEASKAREIAEKNEQLAIEARETAQINFKTSERLRNQQEARASALEALGHFANEDYGKGKQLAQTAYAKNLNNGGFPLQSDIFFSLLYSNFNSKDTQLEIDLEFPAKFIALSTNKEKLAIYTINGEIRIYTTQPKLILSKVIKSGYIQSMEFVSDSQILFTGLEGNLLVIDMLSSKSILYTEQLAKNKYMALFKIPGEENIWIATNQTGGVDLLNFQKTNGFFKIKEKNGGQIQAIETESDKVVWAEGNKFFTSSIFEDDKRLLFTAPSEISSITWSKIHLSWIVGLKSGQLLVIHPDRTGESVETFSIHGSKISHLKIIPYIHNTELMFSTGFDGSIYIYVLDKNLPFSSSISSRISFPKHKSWITGFAIDPDKKLAYSISNDRSLKIWPLAIDVLVLKN